MQIEAGANTLTVYGFTREEVELVKDQVCRGATDAELKLFLRAAKHFGLDPLARQIHALKRWNSDLNREVMTPQVGIDGFRLVAERTGRYAPGPRPVFTYDDQHRLLSCVASVKKYVQNEWHIVEGEAFWEEYVARKKNGDPNRMWSEKPHVMLGKCAEAAALRKAFPAELSGAYLPEETEREEVAYAAPGTARGDIRVERDPAELPAHDAAAAQELRELVRSASSQEALVDLVPRIKKLPDTAQAQLRAAYGARVAELKAQKAPPPEDDFPAVPERVPGEDDDQGAA